MRRRDVELTGPPDSTADPTAPPSGPLSAPAREPRRVVVYCGLLLGAALGAVAVLLVAGSPLPPAGPMLLLALVLALCVNRVALFPTEQAATAEAAVLVAAVVAFRADAAFLGPVLLGLLVGVLDALHWEQRSYLRMAHNAGNRALAALAAAGGFALVTDALGTSALVIALAAGAAALAFAVVDVALSVTLLRLQGDAPRAALQHVLAIDALTLPLALYGAATGVLAGEVGWWATAITLVPVAFVPELVLVRARWRATAARDVVLAVAAVAVVGALAVLLDVPDAVTLATLVALAVVVGAELGDDARVAVPPLLAAIVIAALVVTDGDRAWIAALLVATVGTGATRLGRPRPHLARALLAAAVAGAAAAGIAHLAPASTAGRAAVVLAAGAAFDVMGTLASRRSRRAALALADVAWRAPLWASALAGASVWVIVGEGGGLVFAAVLALTVVVATWWGTPPWPSRAGRGLTPNAPRHVDRVAVGVALAAVALVALGPVSFHGDARLISVWLGVACGEAAVVMAAWGVRQWRFVARTRRRALVTLLVVALALVLAVPELATTAASVVAPAATALLMVVTVAVARVPARRVREVVEARSGAR